MTQTFEEPSFSESEFDRLIVPTESKPFETNRDNFHLLSSSRLQNRIVDNTKKNKTRPSLDEEDLALSHEVLLRLDEKENNANTRD